MFIPNQYVPILGFYKFYPITFTCGRKLGQKNYGIVRNKNVDQKKKATESYVKDIHLIKEM